VRLVLVDNDDDALDLAVLDLRLEGHEIAGVARSGEEAVRMCDELRPEVLVVDYRMPPGIDGLEVARRVVARGSAGRVLVYSNYGSSDLRAEAAAIGVTWLGKGDLARLRAAVSGHGRSLTAEG
jgi:two-component system response regulator YesN